VIIPDSAPSFPSFLPSTGSGPSATSSGRSATGSGPSAPFQAQDIRSFGLRPVREARASDCGDRLRAFGAVRWLRWFLAESGGKRGQRPIYAMLHSHRQPAPKRRGAYASGRSPYVGKPWLREILIHPASEADSRNCRNSPAVGPEPVAARLAASRSNRSAPGRTPLLGSPLPRPCFLCDEDYAPRPPLRKFRQFAAKIVRICFICSEMARSPLSAPLAGALARGRRRSDALHAAAAKNVTIRPEIPVGGNVHSFPKLPFSTRSPGQLCAVTTRFYSVSVLHNLRNSRKGAVWARSAGSTAGRPERPGLIPDPRDETPVSSRTIGRNSVSRGVGCRRVGHVVRGNWPELRTHRHPLRAKRSFAPQVHDETEFRHEGFYRLAPIGGHPRRAMRSTRQREKRYHSSRNSARRKTCIPSRKSPRLQPLESIRLSRNATSAL
jgi:hypothetical protein